MTFFVYFIQNDHTDQTKTLQKSKIEKVLMGQRNWAKIFWPPPLDDQFSRGVNLGVTFLFYNFLKTIFVLCIHSEDNICIGFKPIEWYYRMLKPVSVWYKYWNQYRYRFDMNVETYIGMTISVELYRWVLAFRKIE